MKIEAFDSFVLQKKIPAKELNQIINEVMDNLGLNLLKYYLSQYEHNGSQFVKTFIKYDSIQSSCKWVIVYAIRQGLVIHPDEKVKAYVERLQIGAKGETLEKLLNIFLMIKEK